MSTIKRAITRVKQRANLPAGDRIVPFDCVSCGYIVWYWSDDPVKWRTGFKTCPFCKGTLDNSPKHR